jgi:hypothetical protein
MEKRNCYTSKKEKIHMIRLLIDMLSIGDELVSNMFVAEITEDKIYLKHHDETWLGFIYKKDLLHYQGCLTFDTDCFYNYIEEKYITMLINQYYSKLKVNDRIALEYGGHLYYDLIILKISSNGLLVTRDNMKKYIDKTFIAKSNIKLKERTLYVKIADL